MMNTNNVTEERGFFAPVLDDNDRVIKVKKARLAFSGITGTTKPEHFSALVHGVCERDDLDVRQKYDVLHVLVCRFCFLLTSDAVVKYLKLVEKDFVFGMCLLKEFQKLDPTDRQLVLGDEEVWLAESVLHAMEILSPADLKHYAAQVRELFPKLPGWDPDGNHQGTMKHFENIALGHRPEKLNVPYSIERTQVVESFVVPDGERLSALPGTKNNLRKWKRAAAKGSFVLVVAAGA